MQGRNLTSQSMLQDQSMTLFLLWLNSNLPPFFNNEFSIDPWAANEERFQ
jgi:hypothetical protein